MQQFGCKFFPMAIKLFFSIVLLISFFLPWIDFGFYSFNGYTLPTSLDKLIAVDRIFTGSEDFNYLKFSYLLYLIPLCTCFSMIIQITSKGKSVFWGEFIFGLLGVIMVFLYVFSITEDVVEVFGIGFYLTGIASFVGLFLPINKVDKQVTAKSGVGSKINVNEDLSYVSTSITQKELLDELSKLYSLHQKKVIDDEVFENGKQSILLQLKEKEKGL